VSRYTADSRDRVIDAVDMIALVSTRTDLRRAGVNSYFGLCPFHDERSGSFHVRPDEKHYHCFGCQSSGDPFTFVMETEGLDFKAAMESLADRFGVQLETEAEDPAAATIARALTGAGLRADHRGWPSNSSGSSPRSTYIMNTRYRNECSCGVCRRCQTAPS